MSSLDDYRFPLDNARLPKLLVDAETVREWTTVAKAEVANVIQNLDSWYFRTDELTGSFKLVYEREPLLGYTRASDNVGNKNDFLCHGKLQLALNDVAFALRGESTLEFRSAQAQLYPESFLDAAVLCVVEGPTSSDSCRFTGVKWEAHGSSGSGLISARDYVYFESLSTTRDAHGRTVVVQYVESLALSAHELRDHGIPLARAHTFAINTFRTDPADGCVLYQSAGSVGVTKHTPSWSTTVKGLPHSFRVVLNFTSLADARTILSLGVLRKLPMQTCRQDASEMKTCNVCDKKFNVLTRTRHKCRSCGRSACRNCIMALRFFNERSMHSPRDHASVSSERFCVKCVMNYRELRRCNGSLSQAQSCPESTSHVGSTSISSNTTSDSSNCTDAAAVVDSSTNGNVWGELEVDRDNGETATEQTQSRLANQSLNPEPKTHGSAGISTSVAYSPPSSVQRWSADAVAFELGTQPNARSFCASTSVPTRPASSRRSRPIVVVPTTDPFVRMSESIAAQSALLQKLRSSMSVAATGSSVPLSAPEPNASSCRLSPSPPISSSSSDRFEIL